MLVRKRTDKKYVVLSDDESIQLNAATGQTIKQTYYKLKLLNAL